MTITTVGYGDLTPEQPFQKLFTAVFALVGVGFVGPALASLVEARLDELEALEERAKARSALSDLLAPVSSAKAAIAHITVVILVGSVVFAVLEEIRGNLIHAPPSTVHSCSIFRSDALYLAVITATTVGYGDHAPTIATGLPLLICVLSLLCS